MGKVWVGYLDVNGSLGRACGEFQSEPSEYFFYKRASVNCPSLCTESISLVWVHLVRKSLAEDSSSHLYT